MRYWVYINDKVDGPYEEEKLVTLQGFTPDTLICSEESASGKQEWVKASSIFEFDQVVENPVASDAPATTQTAATAAVAGASAAASDDIAKLLLEKLDTLTREMTGLQSKLDTMQTKMNEEFAAAKSARESQQPAPAFVPPAEEEKNNTITLTRQELPTEEDPITSTENLVSQAENMVASAKEEEKPLDMLGPVDLGEKTEQPEEITLESKPEDAAVLRSAMDSLYNAQVMEQTQEEKESTFQDLLTPQQAKALAAQADAKEAQKAEENSAKEALFNELTQQPKDNVVDQIIQEKEEEKKGHTFKMAAAGALAGLATAVGLRSLANKDDKKEEQPAEEPKAEEPAEKQSLDIASETPALSIATDPAEPAKVEEVAPAHEMPADLPQVEEKPEEAAQPQEAAPAPQPQEGGLNDLPSLDSVGTPAVATPEEDKKEETIQELVPGAKMEKPEGVLITDEDLKDAFAERDNQEDKNVDQLFGVATATGATQETAAPAEEQPTDGAEPSLPQFSDQTVDKPLPMGNPNDLTEIELKEGSTYLISDFVPPAQANGDALPQELNRLDKTNTQTKEKDATEIQEMVPLKKQEEKSSVTFKNQEEKPVEPATDAPKDVTVSQVILENTIKTKRGATLDIKTVPMVPEPAQTERLHFDELSDDINSQHDLKSADVKPTGGAVKAIVGAVVALVIAAVIYVMLAFMNLIPAQFNLLSDDKAAVTQAAEQNAQMAEMLGEETPAPVQQQPAEPAVNPMEATLNEVKNFPLVNGYTLEEYINQRHPAARDLITWDISSAVDPDNYSILVKVPPENPQSFKISYRFNYNTVTKALDPTISDAKNLLDSAAQGQMPAAPQAY